jgi:hypothetical protein
MHENPYQAPDERQGLRRVRYTGCLSGCLWLSAFWIWLFVFAGLGYVLWVAWPLLK